MNPTLYDLLLHAVIPLISSAVAGLGAYFGVKYAIKDHAQRLDLLVIRQLWVIRKMIALMTQHNSNHPEDKIGVNDFPIDPGGAFQL